MVWQLVVTFAVAALGGVAAERMHVPGGAILGAMIGAAVVTLAADREIFIPGSIKTGALIVIGTTIGAQVSREALQALAAIMAPALVSAVLIIVAGLAITLLLRAFGIAPPEDVLATSPGALSVIAGVAIDRGTAPAEVAVFHLVRIVLVILSLPLVLSLGGRG